MNQATAATHGLATNINGNFSPKRRDGWFEIYLCVRWLWSAEYWAIGFVARDWGKKS
jgi:hypothetical protein